MNQSLLPPDEIYGELFRDVQLSGIFSDSKTFVDCTAKRDQQAIVADYLLLKKNGKINDLQAFVEENFFIPENPHSDYHTNTRDIVKHVHSLWLILRRRSQTVLPGSTMLPLPFEYIIPGGRFREIYYWDSYFTMLGLKESKRYDIMEFVIMNFAHLITQHGHMPNGSRTYYLSRSQPPFFSLMIDLLAEVRGEETYTRFLPELQKEYDYWMDKNAPTKHVMQMEDGSTLNRYWDQLCVPRQESYAEDYNVVKNLSQEEHDRVCKDLRSAAESGWDFSSRWLKDQKTLATIQTTSLIPVDLNCLLYHIETILASAYAKNGEQENADIYKNASEKRKAAINKYCWSDEKQWYVDYNIETKQRSDELTLAGTYPYFVSISDDEKMKKSVQVINECFLKPGGVVTTLIHTGEQWDAPNGWAPLQWSTIIGLENYGEKELARTIAERWVSLNKKVFEATGKLVEKYNVMNANEPGGGGEYPSQDGFGWSNGVLLALMKKYNLE